MQVLSATPGVSDIDGPKSPMRPTAHSLAATLPPLSPGLRPIASLAFLSADGEDLHKSNPWQKGQAPAGEVKSLARTLPRKGRMTMAPLAKRRRSLDSQGTRVASHTCSGILKCEY